MAADKQPHDLSGILLGTGEFSFSDGAATVVAAQAAGWQDFGNITAFSIQSKNDAVEHKGAYRGVRRLDKTVSKELTAGYQLKCDEVESLKMATLFYGTVGSNYTQPIRSAVAADALTSPVKDRWYDLVISGARVRELTTVAIVSTPSVVEDTDYVVDYKLGRIRFVTTPPGTLTSITITAPAITATAAGTFKTITPMNKPTRNGMARLTVWNNDGSLVLDHYDFYCEITPSGDFNIGDAVAEITIDVKILSPVGTIGVVPRAF